MELTITAALALDLREFYLSAPPGGAFLDGDRVRLDAETDDLPSPCLVIQPAAPRRQPRMDGTAIVPVVLEFSSSLDRMSPADHRATAGALDEWWRGIRASRRRAVIASRVYLHDLLTQQPVTSVGTDERELVTLLRGDMIVTLVAI